MIYFTSDCHFFHQRILEICPQRKTWGCSTMEEMNELLIERYNSKITEKDDVYFIGDVVMGLKSETIPKIIPRLNGKKYLIPGNHDGMFGRNGEAYNKSVQFYLKNGFITVFSAEHKLTINDNVIRLCHFPYDSVADHEGYEERYAKYKLKNDGILLLHGHTHSTKAITGPNMLHVGVDAWDGFPVSLNTLLSLEKQYDDSSRND